MDANKNDKNPEKYLVMSKWPQRDQVPAARTPPSVSSNARADDQALPANDRRRFTSRSSTRSGSTSTPTTHYWDNRQVATSLRFEDWAARVGDCWKQKCEPSRVEARQAPVAPMALSGKTVYKRTVAGRPATKKAGCVLLAFCCW